MFTQEELDKAYIEIEARHTTKSDTELSEDRQIELLVEFADRVKEAKEARGSIDDEVRRKMCCLAGIVVNYLCRHPHPSGAIRYDVLFDRIWEVTKHWDLYNGQGLGYASMSGDDVRAIIAAISPERSE